jgi:lysozyme
MKKLSPQGYAFLHKWEGLRLAAYQDDAGVWTIGYGHTGSFRGKGIHQGMEITKADADLLLRQDVAFFEADVNRLVKVPLTQGEFDALVCWHFNTGALAKSTLLKKLNANLRDDVPDEILRWNKITVGGKKVVSQGLKNRRAAEVVLWGTGMPLVSSALDVTPSAPPVVSKENIAFAAGIVPSVAAGSTILEGSGPVQYALAAVVLVAFAVALLLFFKRRGK